MLIEVELKRKGSIQTATIAYTTNEDTNKEKRSFPKISKIQWLITEINNNECLKRGIEEIMRIERKHKEQIWKKNNNFVSIKRPSHHKQKTQIHICTQVYQE